MQHNCKSLWDAECWSLNLHFAGLLLRACYLQNLPVEKEVIADWILAGTSFGKGQLMDTESLQYNSF